MTVAMHQTTSAAAGYRKSLEGWARAGIRQVEITHTILDDFLTTDTLTAARSILTDLNLEAVQGATGVNGLFDPNPNHTAAHDELKRRCEMYAQLGLKHVYATTQSTVKPELDDYKAAVGHLRTAASIAAGYNLAFRVEFLRQSMFISTLPTMLKLVREAAHANLGLLFDFYHFLSGASRMEDLDLLKPGEVAHVHIQDVPDLPREMLDPTTRVIPGDGIAPVSRIVKKLASLNYSGPLTVELFLPKYQQADPETLAREILRKTEAVAGELILRRQI